jgi:hypothetical protein
LKKLRKTFLRVWAWVVSTPREAEQKSFLVTFFQKSNFFLSFGAVHKVVDARPSPA